MSEPNLVAVASDPQTTGTELQELAASHPDLWPVILQNPNCYPDLAVWITQQQASATEPSRGPAPGSSSPSIPAAAGKRTPWGWIAAGIAVLAVGGVALAAALGVFSGDGAPESEVVIAQEEAAAEDSAQNSESEDSDNPAPDPDPDPDPEPEGVPVGEACAALEQQLEAAEGRLQDMTEDEFMALMMDALDMQHENELERLATLSEEALTEALIKVNVHVLDQEMLSIRTGNPEVDAAWIDLGDKVKEAAEVVTPDKALSGDYDALLEDPSMLPGAQDAFDRLEALCPGVVNS